MGVEHNVRFGELRSLLHGAAEGPGTWARVCRLVERWPDPGAFEREVVPYVEGHTSGWSARTRLAPVCWLERALGGDVEPALRLTRRIELTRFPGLDVEPELSLQIGVPIEMRPLSVERPLGANGAALLGRLSRPGGVLEQLVELSLTGQDAVDGLVEEVLGDPSAFPSLQVFGLRDETLDARACDAICAFASRRAVASLTFPWVNGGGVVTRLHGAGALEGLRSLTLDGDDLEHELELLFQSPRLERLVVRDAMLQHLFWYEGEAQPAALRALDMGGELTQGVAPDHVEHQPWFGRLDTLGMSGWDLTPWDSDTALGRLSAGWRSLDLSFASLGEQGWRTLVAQARALRHLDASYLKLGEDAWAVALGSEGLVGLESLKVGGGRTRSADEVARLVAAPVVSGLDALDVGPFGVGDGGVDVFWRGLERTSVRRLSVAENLKLAEGLRRVSALGRVTRLNVAGCDLVDEDLEAFVLAPWARQLEQLDLRMNLLSGDAVATARAALPECDVIWYPHGPMS